MATLPPINDPVTGQKLPTPLAGPGSVPYVPINIASVPSGTKMVPAPTVISDSDAKKQLASMYSTLQDLQKQFQAKEAATAQVAPPAIQPAAPTEQPKTAAQKAMEGAVTTPSPGTATTQLIDLNSATQVGGAGTTDDPTIYRDKTGGAFVIRQGGNPNNPQDYIYQGGATPLNSIDEANKFLAGENADYKTAIQGLDDKITKAHDDYQNSLTQYQTGSLPLTPSQQAMINSVKQQLEVTRQAQIKYNEAFTAGQTVLEQRMGRSQYANDIASGNIKATVDQGISKLVALDNQASEVIAKLTEGFNTDNLKVITDSYNSYISLMDKKSTQLKSMHDDIIQQKKDLRDFSYKQLQDKIVNKIDQSRLDLESGKFDWQKSQDEIKNTIDKSNLSINERKQALAEATFNMQKQIMEKIDSVPSPTTLSSGQQDPISQQKFLQQFPSLIQEKIKGIADYSVDPKSLTTSAKQAMGGFTQSDLIAIAKKYDHTYDEKEYAARQKFLSNWKAGGQNSVITSANTAIQHLAELKKQGDALKNTSAGTLGPFTTKYNSVRQWLSESSGNPQVTQFKQTAVALAGELAKIYKNSIGSSAAPTDDEIKYQLEQLSANMSPQQIDASIQNSVQLMTDRLLSSKENYQTNMGKPPADILTPSSKNRIEELKNAGIDINIDALSPSQYGGVSSNDLINAMGGQSQGGNSNELLNILNTNLQDLMLKTQ